MPTALRQVTLEDKYTHSSGTVLMSGTQALVRLPLMQQARDRARGLRTAGYITGYRGSPLGGLDQQLWRAQRYLEAAGIVFEPGVNEDLAATAIWGTQQVPLLPGARVQGVFALWYGKGPGVDRSGDPIKHGNRMGTSPLGGVLLAVGDDHAGKSSTVAHQSEPALAANQVPVLYPATVQEYLELGLRGWALSRYAGLWVALKCVNDTVEATATVDLDFAEPAALLPAVADVHARLTFNPLADDERLQRVKLPAAQAFARAQGFDRKMLGDDAAPLGIVAAGKSYLDCLAALRLLGLDGAERASPVALFKPALIWPLEPQALREFARNRRELLVVEEKAPFLEPQIAHALFNLPAAERPLLTGKRDEQAMALLPSDVTFDAGTIAPVIAQRLARLQAAAPAVSARAREIQQRRAQHSAAAAPPLSRAPYFCSGCPHNTSTQVPEGSVAFSGIGCHTMAIGMQRRTLPPTHMGGEGMTWAGIAPFTATPHVFQNLGDGTYFHSGLLAIRAAVAARVNITYKVLVNDAVAMTGGQPVEGHLSLMEMSHQLAAERVRPIAVVSDDPGRWRARHAEFAAGVTFHHRDELDALQRRLRDVRGVSAILYEQTCAAEKRRRRKRGTLAKPDRRVFINAAVCEGCGDCSIKSNCVSVEPLETEFGRKRRIDQSSCNQDYSCIRGLCPSFVILENARPRRPQPPPLSSELFAALPEPPQRAALPFNAVIAGVGGTGVVTIGAVLAMAAHLEDAHACVLDMTGLAQKGGAVLSHLRITATPAAAPAALETGSADLLLACDLVVGVGAEALHTVDAQRTQLLLNDCVTPVAQFQQDRDFDFRNAALLERARQAVAPQHLAELPATRLAERLLGDTIATNMIMVGFAYQHGALPVSSSAIEQAIAINGTARELNLAAFALGRLWQHAPERLRELLPLAAPAALHTDLAALIERRSDFLADYQDAAYAARYRELIERVRLSEASRCGKDELTIAVARQYSKLLAYKDEYEVARLYTRGEFRLSLGEQFEGDYRLRVLLAPPFLTRDDPRTGEPRKLSFGAWIFPLLGVLARGRRLRGTAWDPFGYLAERRTERELIREYELTIDTVLRGLTPERHAAAIEIAQVPEQIRGFGPVKRRSVAAARARTRQLLAAYTSVA
ncbi:MAG TPA: indolepyruvate ferredoxin oxidoreductase family protein [Steroidobacteraceae bacterium]|nr:indolepyruvate ferredoxin oxidoreductase family protein [Steroidobacteraceae bacterium]